MVTAKANLIHWKFFGFFNSALWESGDCLQDHSLPVHQAALFRNPWSVSDGSPLDPETGGLSEVSMSSLAGMQKGIGLS